MSAATVGDFARSWANATRRVLDRRDKQLEDAHIEMARLRAWLIDEIGYVPSGFPEHPRRDAA